MGKLESFDDDDGDSLTASDTLLQHDASEQGQVLDRRRRKNSVKSLFVQITAMVIYGLIVAALTFVFSNRSCTGERLIYSPVNDLIEYETKLYNSSLRGDPDYFGTPSPQVDANWHDLLWPAVIHLTEEERMHYDHEKPIVQYPDGTYSGGLFVYHELHCLKRLYQYINADYYFSELTDQEREMNKQHTAHCLGTLRQAVMCHSDVTVMPLVWGKRDPRPLGDFFTRHQCVNFEKIHAWAYERTVTDALEPGVLVHPSLGPSFPDGHGTKIGFDIVDVDEEGNVITFDGA